MVFAISVFLLCNSASSVISIFFLCNYGFWRVICSILHCNFAIFFCLLLHNLCSLLMRNHQNSVSFCLLVITLQNIVNFQPVFDFIIKILLSVIVILELRSLVLQRFKNYIYLNGFCQFACSNLYLASRMPLLPFCCVL